MITETLAKVTPMEWSTWWLTALSLIGVVLNIKKQRLCFAIWTFTNAAWAVVDFFAGLPAQGTLFSIYCVLAIWGFFSWKPTWRERRIR
jgi:nicotinamide riboside transporter PnuC